MKRTAPDRTANQPRPVERVEVDEKNVKRRVILLIAAIVAAIAAFGYGINSLTSVDSGWRTIEADGASRENCAQDFVFEYRLGSGGISATAENKALVLLYTQATERAYRIFNHLETFEDTVNPCWLNQNPNTPVKVDPVLYEAFETLEAAGARYLYLAPVYQEYQNLFFCQEDWETAVYDPYQNPDMAAYFSEAAAYARDPASVDLRLLGDHQVELYVSDEYLAFLKASGAERIIDFYWMTDAFIVDYLARLMEAEGYTRGVISSYDGFVRTLSGGEERYAFHVHDQAANGLIAAVAVMDYPAGASLVHLHAFPLNTQKEIYYYRFEDGTVRHPYASLEDGKSRAAAPVLIATAYDKGCAQTLLALLPHYIRDSLDEAALMTLPAQGVYPLWCRDRRIVSTDPRTAVQPADDSWQVKNP